MSFPDSLNKKVLQVRERIAFLNLQLQIQKSLEKTNAENLQKEQQEVDDLNEVRRVLRFLFERINKSNEDLTARLATASLQEAFVGEDLTLEVSHEVVRGQSSVSIEMFDRKRGVKGDPLMSFGGGPAALLGVVLRVISVLRQPGFQRLLILDEPIVQVSDQHRERAAHLLRRLCDPVEEGGLGFSMLVVTHDEIIKSVAHRSYLAQVHDDGKSLVLEEINRDS